MTTPQKTAIVLFNLGGPDGPDAVKPFLFNLFNDPSIIRVPQPMRTMLAYLISRRRAPQAREIYAQMGGGSPLLPNTRAQADALQEALRAPGHDARCFIAMRYWHPMTLEAAEAVKAYDPDRIVLLPLYPQYSTTTTASSRRVWDEACRTIGLDKPTQMLCCYPTEGGFVAANAEKVRAALAEASAHGRPRLLLSYHGLPEKIVRTGDPYQWQCERTSEAIVAALGMPGLDWVTCYQSRVGPMKWIGPATEDEVARAGADKVPLVVLPAAFVSEHSETLVEIGEEYRHLAQEKGVPFYARVDTVGTAPAFIRGLADLVRGVLASAPRLCSQDGGRICPARHGGCPHKAA
ncbi:MAG TPA: ferrochelatase [Alphaproteobacteria bacterium]|nr:ferrochelatase [Alphaproteobacteria bacterium]